MAQVSVSGLSELIGDLDAVRDLPDSMIEDMLLAQAKIIRRGQQAYLDQAGLKDTGQLRDSITAARKMKRDSDGKYLDIYPKGKRTRRKKGGGSKISAATNNEVGFIHEYGSPYKHIPARHWMQRANDANEAKAAAAAEKKYDDYLKKKNL